MGSEIFKIYHNKDSPFWGKNTLNRNLLQLCLQILILSRIFLNVTPEDWIWSKGKWKQPIFLPIRWFSQSASSLKNNNFFAFLWLRMCTHCKFKWFPQPRSNQPIFMGFPAEMWHKNVVPLCRNLQTIYSQLQTHFAFAACIVSSISMQNTCIQTTNVGIIQCLVVPLSGLFLTFVYSFLYLDVNTWSVSLFGEQ